MRNQLFSSVAHLLPPLFFLVASVVLMGIINNDTTLKALDRVTLYGYRKPTVDRDKALAVHEAKGDFAWLDDSSDADHCLDMSALNYPTASFISGDDPTGPFCQITLLTQITPGQSATIVVTPYYTQQSVSSCREGTYPIQVSGGGSGPMLAGTVNIKRSAPAAPATQVGWTITVTGDAPGALTYTFSQSSKWNLCKRRREELANQYLNFTSCEHESSQMCTCVAAFASKVRNLGHALKHVKDNGLQKQLTAGVDKCLQLRRAHDVRVPGDKPYARTDALLYFALALGINALHHVLMLWTSSKRIRGGAHVSWLVLLFVFANNNGGEVKITLCVLLPLIPLAIYEALATYRFSEAGAADGAFYLHPVAFDVCLCALSLFTLVERGVVQREYLIAEIIKCHAIAGVYWAGTWFHRHLLRPDTADGRVFLTADVEHGFRLLYLCALAAAGDTLLVPYPTKSCFRLHWLLPLAFTYLSLSNPSIARPILARLKAPLHGPEGKAHGAAHGLHYNHLSAVLCVGVGLVMWGYFLLDYVRAYGADHFLYPSYLYPSEGGLALLVRSI